MRELKFRVWDAVDRRYYYWSIEACFTVGASAGCMDKYTFEQYTGLKDKNGKEIYEGDVIRFDNVDAEAEVSDPAMVVYENGAVLAKCSDGRFYTFEDDVPVILGFIKPELFEVIGNIHENQELLEDK